MSSSVQNTCFYVYSGFHALSAVRCSVVYPCRGWIIFEEIYSIFMRKHKYVSLFQKQKRKQKAGALFVSRCVSPFFKCVLRKVQRECNTGGPLGPSMYSASADRLHCQLVRKIPLLSLFPCQVKQGQGSQRWIHRLDWSWYLNSLQQNRLQVSSWRHYKRWPSCVLCGK